MDTTIGEQGVKLSGDQKQRLPIARVSGAICKLKLNKLTSAQAPAVSLFWVRK